MQQLATTVMRQTTGCFLWIALAVAIVPASHAQAPHDDLPPLRDVGAAAADQPGKPISVADLQLLVPPAQLICWSHGASENPQDSHDNGEDSSGSFDSPADPILTTASLTPRNETAESKDYDRTDHSHAPEKKKNPERKKN